MPKDAAAPPGANWAHLMGFRLKITIKTERKFLVLSARPFARWCDACGSESTFVDEEREASSLAALTAAASGGAHRVVADGRTYLCLRSISAEP